jgi:hypothetical protein
MSDADAIAATPDRRGPPGRAGHRVRVEVDIETVLGEPATRADRRLGLALGLDPGPLQPVVQLPGAIGVVAVDAAVDV